MDGVVLTMADRILLLLGLSDAEEGGIAIEKTSDRRDVKVNSETKRREERAVERAFTYAESKSKNVIALQILNSDLYHYGHTDLLLPGPGKKRFLNYVRDELLKKGNEREKTLREWAQRRGISLEVRTVESQDPASVAIEEAKKGYDKIFLPKEKKRRFPILKKTVEEHLRKEISIPLVPCE
jgi:hypothetical protein